MIEPVEKLTPRELSVLALWAQGYTARQAGAELSLSRRTIETHLDHIRDKLQLTGRGHRIELFRYAREINII
jgi:DNA-binding NarL/FixJ family response regulator